MKSPIAAALAAVALLTIASSAHAGFPWPPALSQAECDAAQALDALAEGGTAAGSVSNASGEEYDVYAYDFGSDAVAITGASVGGSVRIWILAECSDRNWCGFSTEPGLPINIQSGGCWSSSGGMRDGFLVIEHKSSITPTVEYAFYMDGCPTPSPNWACAVI